MRCVPDRLPRAPAGESRTEVKPYLFLTFSNNISAEGVEARVYRRVWNEPPDHHLDYLGPTPPQMGSRVQTSLVVGRTGPKDVRMRVLQSAADPVSCRHSLCFRSLDNCTLSWESFVSFESSNILIEEDIRVHNREKQMCASITSLALSL